MSLMMDKNEDVVIASIEEVNPNVLLEIGERISISLGLTITKNLGNNNIYVDHSFDLLTDEAEWYVYAMNWCGCAYENLPNNFQFLNGTELESDLNNNGFKMDVDYNVHLGSHGDEIWSDTIIFDKSNEDLGYND